MFLALWGDSDERSAGRQLVGVGTGMAGVALLLGIDVGTGGLELIGAPSCCSRASRMQSARSLKRRLGEVQPVGMAAGAVSAGAAYLLLPAVVTFPTSAPSLDATAALVALGVGGTGPAFLFSLHAHRRGRAARASVVAYLALDRCVRPASRCATSSVTSWTLVGPALVLGGSWPASRPRPLPARLSRSLAAVRSGAR